MARFAAAAEIAFSGRPERAVAGAGLRPDLNGLLLTMPAKQIVYLIDRGYRRWIDNRATLERLFGPRAPVVVTEAAVEVIAGTPLSREARLVRQGRTIYLVDTEPDGRELTLRPIAAGALHWFRGEKVETLDRRRLGDLPVGSAFDGPRFD